MEGTLFYWFAWMGWTISTFFLAKTRQRIVFSALLLILIYCSAITLDLDGQLVNLSLFIIILISYAYLGMQKFRELWYSIFMSSIISISYVGMHFVVVYDPVWIFIDLNFFIAIPLSLIVLLMAKDFHVRLSVLTSGYAHGEIAYITLFKDLAPDYVIGSFIFLDIISLSCMIVYLWSLYELFTSTLKVKIDKPVKHVKENIQ
ncbi:hypothetical protein [Alkalihalobacillus sp. TS-13]|uniref:YphA family membrane protein n=1 Tax=Alkalihalobacillus sp. TS-13 TaxID=2842455 RepID=UPI001C868126|nr:hypothetical protein [Alkalihalobacillus sp. TS-13]